MFIVIVDRAYKVNTGATEKYAPRTRTEVRKFVSGPFRTERAAQRAVLSALESHSCLGAVVMSAEQVKARLAHGGLAGWESDLLAAARKALESVEFGG